MSAAARNQDGDAVLLTCPADAVFVRKVIILTAVCIHSSDHQHKLQVLSYRRHIVVRNTVKVTVEYARITVLAKKDHSVSQ